MVRHFNTFLSINHGRNRQKIRKDIVNLNNIINQLNLIDIHWTFHPTVAEYTLSSNAQGIFTSKHHILGSETNLNKFKRIQFIKSLFSDHDGIELETNRKILRKALTIWRLNNMLYQSKMKSEEQYWCFEPVNSLFVWGEDGGCLVHCRVFRSIPGLCSLDITLLPTSHLP